jgi:D-alanyl-D-alanine carboxypeptidase
VWSGARLQDRLDELQAQHPDVPGFALTVIHRGQLLSAATGQADPEGRAMTATTPLRQASISKTLVAAAVLRLVETDRLGLDDAVREWISPEHRALLVAEGYDPAVMSLHDLLTHSAGLADHFGHEAFTRAVLADPQRVWTRSDQLALMSEVTEPLGHAEPTFAYSDSGYLLLGEVLEVRTGMPLAEAVVELNRFERLGLNDSYWEGQEAPAAAPRRAHQAMDGLDTTFIHGSVDAFGGGGWIASTDDVARYFEALFAGRVFDRPETLALMTGAPGHPPGSPYRYGLFERRAGDQIGYSHGGFWGTEARAYPDLGLTMAAAALDSAGIDALRDLLDALVEEAIL